MTTVALDTNALMMPVECDVRVFEAVEREVGGFEAVAPRSVATELEALADGAGEAATAASVGLDLLERCELRATGADNADDAVVELAGHGDVDVVVTNDGPLRERLLDETVPVISLRGKDELATTRP